MGQVLLVRHGQASWDADDYDVLSETGWEQARLLGRSLAARGIVPDVVVTGGMRRHRETAQALLGEMGTELEEETDADWAEFDHVAMMGAVPTPWTDRPDSPAQFQAWFEEAVDRWVEGQYDAEYGESFTAFTDRVDAALARAAKREGTVLVSTSGGPIAWCTAALLTEDPGERARLWRRLNPVCVNSGVTRLVTGRRGTTLVSFNEHAHLDGVPGMLTYR